MPSKWAGLAAALLAAIGLSSSFAQAEIVSEVSAGMTLPLPLGLAGDIYNRPVGGEIEGWFRIPGFLPENLELSLTTQYFQFAVQNISGSSGVQINVGYFGVYTGATIWGSPTLLGIRPSLGGSLGLIYDFMTFPGAAGFSGNSGTSFALRLEPGFDVPISGRLGVFFEFPMTVAFQKPTNLSFWESVFALRWKL